MAPFGPVYPTPYRESWAIRAVLLLAALLVIYWGRGILAPLALALLLTIAALPMTEWLEARRVPRWLSVTLVLLLVLGVLLGLAGLLASQVVALAAELPRYEAVLRAKLSLLSEEAGPFERLVNMLGRLGAAMSAPVPAGQPLVRLADPPEAPFRAVLDAARVVVAPFATLGVTLLLMGFLLAQREDARDRVLRLAGLQDMHRTTQAMGDATSRLGRYLLAQVALNGVYGLVIAAALWLIGLPNAPLWGLLAFGLRFVPFVGTPLAVLFPLLLAMAIDPGWGSALWVAGLFAVASILAAYGLEPLVYRASIGIAPFAHVISVVFWALMWGPLGLILAPALTAGLVILGRHVPGLGFLDVMLGAGEALPAEARFYQRLLAGDARGAGQILAAQGGVAAGLEALVLPAIGRIGAERGQEGYGPALATTAARTLLRVLHEAGEEPALPPAIVVLPCGGALDRAAAAGVALALAEAGHAVTDTPAPGTAPELVVLVLASAAPGHRLRRAMAEAERLAPHPLLFAATAEAAQALERAGLAAGPSETLAELLSALEGGYASSTVTVTSTFSPAKSPAVPT